MSHIIHALRFGLMAGLLLGLFGTSAWADSGWYAGIKGGIGSGARVDVAGSFSIDTDTGPVILGALGYAKGGGRLEVELSWRSNDLDAAVQNIRLISGNRISESSIDNLAFMLNGAFDIPLGPHFKPYLLGGLGFSRVKGEATLTNGVSFEETDTVFASQAGAGLSYQLTDALAFDVSYRLFVSSVVEFDSELSGIDVRNLHHNGLVGLTYSF